MGCLKIYVLMLVLAALTKYQYWAVESVTLAQGTVSILCEIPGTLTAHCQSPGNDLGTQSIPYAGAFTWNVSIVVGKDQAYNCDLTSGSLHGRFDLFDSKRDWSSDRCGVKNFRCYWKVRQDGLYFLLANRKEYVLQYRWS